MPAGQRALECGQLSLTEDSAQSSEDQKADKNAVGKDLAEEAAGENKDCTGSGLQATCVVF